MGPRSADFPVRSNSRLCYGISNQGTSPLQFDIAADWKVRAPGLLSYRRCRRGGRGGLSPLSLLSEIQFHSEITPVPPAKIKLEAASVIIDEWQPQAVITASSPVPAT